MLQVCETFVSIQGESTYAGCPCFFIRLTGCNLRCTFCDTSYAYDGGKPLSVSQLVDDFRSSGMSLAEVTGGEPLIQPGVIDLLTGLQPYGTVLVETNGTQDISPVPAGVTIIMDIKCPGSGESASMDWRNIERLRTKDEVQFVMCDRKDYDWAGQVMMRHHLPKRCHAVLFSPAFQILDPAELAGWMMHDHVSARLNVQIHKVIWDPSQRRV